MTELVYLQRDNAVKAVSTETKKAALIAQGYKVIADPDEKKKKSASKDKDKEGVDGGQSPKPPAN